MLLANDKEKKLILADRDKKGRCPLCEEPLVAKCGQIKIYHWAHKSRSDCDSFAEGETGWHYGWKKLAGLENCEKITRSEYGIHRADIVKRQLVIELQHSSISTYDIEAREKHYRNMIWLFDAREFQENIDFRDQGHYISFRWRHPHKTIAYCLAPVFFDLGYNSIFYLKKMYDEIPCGGWGYIKTKDWFIKRYF